MPFRGEDEAVEPIYGKTYLPRKFKVVLAVPPSNDVDIFAHDLGFIAILDDKGTVSPNSWVEYNGGPRKPFQGITYKVPEGE